MEANEIKTRMFKNIFPSYATFSSWYRSTPLSDDANDVPSEKTFTLIAYEYNTSIVASSPESFKQRFANDLYTYYREFEETTKSILELMKLTDDEISIDGRTIVNFADIPETDSSTDIEEVDYISNQQKTISKKGVLQIKREQLTNKRALTVRNFINRFRHLFVKILSPAYTYVVEEEGDE